MRHATRIRSYAWAVKGSLDAPPRALAFADEFLSVATATRLLVWRVPAQAGQYLPRCIFVGRLQDAGRSAEVLAMTWCPTSREELALVLSDKTVHIYVFPAEDPASLRTSDRLQSHFHPQHAVQVKYCPDGDRLALTTGCDTIEVLDIGDRRVPVSIGTLKCGRRNNGAVVLSFDWQDRDNLIAAIRIETGRVYIRSYTIPRGSQAWDEVYGEAIETERLLGVDADVMFNHGKLTAAVFDNQSNSVTIYLPDGDYRRIDCGFAPPPPGFPAVTLMDGGCGILMWQDGAIQLYDTRKAAVAQRLPGNAAGVMIAFIKVDNIYKQLVIATHEQGLSHRFTIYRGSTPKFTLGADIPTWVWTSLSIVLLAVVMIWGLQQTGYAQEELRSLATKAYETAEGARANLAAWHHANLQFRP
ncbi:hypothetical protein K523DRAFT_257177 [Schizophyllum commune Tattone D]|nr:hypothetical protein K523DRAFT_257177 [Schizophyllum commune Tattone D]